MQSDIPATAIQNANQIGAPFTPYPAPEFGPRTPDGAPMDDQPPVADQVTDRMAKLFPQLTIPGRRSRGHQAYDTARGAVEIEITELLKQIADLRANNAYLQGQVDGSTLVSQRACAQVQEIEQRNKGLVSQNLRLQRQRAIVAALTNDITRLTGWELSVMDHGASLGRNSLGPITLEVVSPQLRGRLRFILDAEDLALRVSSSRLLQEQTFNLYVNGKLVDNDRLALAQLLGKICPELKLLGFYPDAFEALFVKPTPAAPKFSGADATTDPANLRLSRAASMLGRFGLGKAVLTDIPAYPFSGADSASPLLGEGFGITEQDR